MLHLHISDEGILSLWNGLSVELEALVAPHRVPQGFLEMTADRFLEESPDGSSDIFEVVSASAGRAGESILRFRISGSFHCYAASAAKDCLSLNCH